ncbi:PDZK1-interacting protein 1 [Cyprinodon tularosa]|uniref:PDZK1-interacting protein 1 n=1 Tax=Cyprinodon tularosa TaxID=77115 RepID=UPI0018E2304A|nr:PDZK1-interacting protein 1 [Cyprinodon tularosa]
MGSVFELTSCLLLLVGAVTAQTAPSTHFERALPQWLTGIVAVCGFLVLTFMAFLVKKVWCENPKAPVRRNTDQNPYSTSLESIRRGSGQSENNKYEDPEAFNRPRASVDSGKDNIYQRSLDDLSPREGSNIYDDPDDKSTSM